MKHELRLEKSVRHGHCVHSRKGADERGCAHRRIVCLTCKAASVWHRCGNDAMAGAMQDDFLREHGDPPKLFEIPSLSGDSGLGPQPGGVR